MTFWEAFKNSTIIQGLITFMVLGTVCYLVIVGIPVPELLQSVTGLVVGFYFGAKVQASALQGPKIQQ